MRGETGADERSAGGGAAAGVMPSNGLVRVRAAVDSPSVHWHSLVSYQYSRTVALPPLFLRVFATFDTCKKWTWSGFLQQ